MKKIFLLTLTACLVFSYTEAKPKYADVVWFMMERQTDLEKVPNDSIIVSYGIVYERRYPNQHSKYYEMCYPLPHLAIIIQNKTERDIFVDLQKSHLIANEESYPLFTNTTDVSTQGNSTTTGLNLGLVGIGGSSAEYSTTMKQEQRYVHVMGESKKTIDIPLVTKWGVPWQLNNVNGKIVIKPRYETRSTHPSYDITSIAIENNFVTLNEVQHYDATEPPLTMDIRICYSFNEDMNPSFVNKSVYETQHVLGTSYGNGSLEKLSQLGRKIYPSVDSYWNDRNKLLIILNRSYNSSSSNAATGIVGAMQTHQ